MEDDEDSSATVGVVPDVNVAVPVLPPPPPKNDVDLRECEWGAPSMEDTADDDARGLLAVALTTAVVVAPDDDGDGDAFV